LGKLLGGNVHGSPPAALAPKTPEMTPGVATLFQGAKACPPRQPNSDNPPQFIQPNASGGRSRIGKTVKVSLVAGDLAILGLVAWLLLGSGKPLTTTEILICVLAVVLGAWLTCLALYLD
jgi:hypothetical protein